MMTSVAISYFLLHMQTLLLNVFYRGVTPNYFWVGLRHRKETESNI